MSAFLGTLVGLVVGAALTFLIRLRLQQNDASERLTATRRQVYGEFLDAAHEMFLAYRTAHLERLDAADPVDPDAFVHRVDELSPHRGQMALERLRLVATTETEARATVVWNRLRRDPARKDAALSREGLERWVSGYWIAEKEFLAAARHDMGLEPLRDSDRSHDD
jgi:hypothetical protein